MKTSVVVPFHKGGNYLKDCLDSLLEYGKDLEVLLVLDDVKDEEEVWKEYEASLNLKILTLQGKTGVAAARNLGLGHASGEYVFFLDSDDYLTSGALERMDRMAKESGAQFVYAKKQITWYKRSVYRQLKAKEDEAPRKQRSKSFFHIFGKKEAGDIEQEVNLDEIETVEQGEGEETNRHSSHASTVEEVNEEKKATAIRLLLAKKKNIQDVSVLNILFQRSLLQENQIRFHEDVTYYSDLPFVVKALHYAERVEFLEMETYVKRKHNDPIHMPALSQINDEKSFEDLTLSYQYAKEAVPAHCDARMRLDQRLIHHYASVVAPTIRKSNNELWRVKRFRVMKTLVEGMDSETRSSVSRYKRRLIRHLSNGDLTKTIRTVSNHNAYLIIRHLLRNRSEFKKLAYKHYYAKKPLLSNYVLFESFFGKSYSDSPKYIFEYMRERYPNEYQYVWVMNHKNSNLPKGVKRVKRFSFGYFKYLARCKYIVFNSRQPKYFIKRKGNVFLQTWHGTPLKKLVFDMEEVTSASPRYKEEFYVQSRSWDYLVSANYFSTEIFQRAFLFKKKILEYGYPRNDVLHRKDKDGLARGIRKRLGIPTDKKTILYAPTWRDDEFIGRGQYRFDLKLDLSLLRERLGGEYVILLRMHYFIADKLDISDMKGFAYQLSDYDDIAELYLISDILITDYSSVFFDYANLKRPMLFYTYDLENYRDVLRGFYIDMERELPGPLLYTTEEVIKAIQNIKDVEENYLEKYERFYERFCGLENGRASENVVREVFR